MGAKKENGSGNISVNFQGDNHGQVAVGNNITQSNVQGQNAGPVTEVDLAQLEKLLEDLRLAVNTGAASQVQLQDAQSRLADLEEAVKQPTEENVSTMAYVKQWFAKNLPQAAEKVGALLTSPIVTRLVTAAGDAAVAEFRRRFGG